MVSCKNELVSFKCSRARASQNIQTTKTRKERLEKIIAYRDGFFYVFSVYREYIDQSTKASMLVKIQMLVIY